MPLRMPEATRLGPSQRLAHRNQPPSEAGAGEEWSELCASFFRIPGWKHFVAGQCPSSLALPSDALKAGLVLAAWIGVLRVKSEQRRWSCRVEEMKCAAQKSLKRLRAIRQFPCRGVFSFSVYCESNAFWRCDGREGPGSVLEAVCLASLHVSCGISVTQSTSSGLHFASSPCADPPCRRHLSRVLLLSSLPSCL